LLKRWEKKNNPPAVGPGPSLTVFTERGEGRKRRLNPIVQCVRRCARGERKAAKARGRGLSKGGKKGPISHYGEKDRYIT